MKTLVFLHGWGTTGNIWRRQVEAFSSPGMAVLTPTFPVWQVSWLVDYLQTLPLAETVLVGWSLGGMLLLEALSQDLATPAGLVLVASPASFSERPDYPYGQPRVVVRALRRTVRGDTRKGLADFAGRCLAPGEANFRDEILEDFQPRENGADLASGLDYLINSDLRPKLSKVPRGALIIQGDQDSIVPPEQSEVIRHCLKDTRLVNIQGAGHAPFLTRAEEFNEIMERIVGEGVRGHCPLATSLTIHTSEL
jgi:pimeloyl-ACP methyl ester carboxylesterase